MVSTIVLDLDGPILDGRLRHYACYSEILKEQGYVPIDIDSYWDSKRSRMDRRALLKKSEAVEYYDEFRREWMQRIELPAMLALDQLQPEVLSILSEWKGSEKELVIATGLSFIRASISLGYFSFCAILMCARRASRRSSSETCDDKLFVAPSFGRFLRQRRIRAVTLRNVR